MPTFLYITSQNLFVAKFQTMHADTKTLHDRKRSSSPGEAAIPCVQQNSLKQTNMSGPKQLEACSNMQSGRGRSSSKKTVLISSKHIKKITLQPESGLRHHVTVCEIAKNAKINRACTCESIVQLFIESALWGRDIQRIHR